DGPPAPAVARPRPEADTVEHVHDGRIGRRRTGRRCCSDDRKNRNRCGQKPLHYLLRLAPAPGGLTIRHYNRAAACTFCHSFPRRPRSSITFLIPLST